MKVLLIILCFPFLSLAQTEDYSFLNDYFYEDENGLVFSYDIFKDYYYYGELIPDDLKHRVSKNIEAHKSFIESQESISPSLIESYKEFCFLSEIFNYNTLKYSEKIYNLISDDRAYRIYLFDVVSRLVSQYNQVDKQLLSLEILESQKGILENHKHFSCDTSSGMYYYQVGILFYNTYSKLDNVEKQLEYGFKYLLNSKDYSEKLVILLIENYEKEDLRNAFSNLDKSYTKMSVESESFFKFLEYKIGVNGYSGIFNYYNNHRGTTNFKQLQDIWFYKNLKAYLSK